MAVSKNVIIAGSTAAALTGLLGAGAIIKYRRKKAKKRKSSSKVSRKGNYSYYKRRKQKKPYTAGKRKDTSHRRIRYTKNNQPYIILKSGKARFIKKSSVRNSRKRKGGRY